MKIPYTINLAPALNDHWYEVKNAKGRRIGYFPSSSTILHAYPQSAYLTKWIADKGFNEAQEIKAAAGIRGTNVHQGIQDLFAGKQLYMENFSLEEWNKLTTFKKFYDDFTPQLVESEVAVFSKKHGYAGRTDALLKMNDKYIIADWKTSGSIYDSYPLQVASYASAVEELTDFKIESTAILQLGAKNKNGYRWVLYPDWRDHFKTFLNVKKVWEYDNGVDADFEPPVLDLPATLLL